MEPKPRMHLRDGRPPHTHKYCTHAHIYAAVDQMHVGGNHHREEE